MLYSNAILMWNSSDIAHTATFVIYIARKLQSQDIWSLSVFGKLLETPTPPTAHFSVVNQINHLPSVRSPAAPSWCFLDMILIFIKPPLVVNQKVQVTPTAWTPPSTHMALLMPLSPLDPKKHTSPYKNNNTSSSAKWSQIPEILRCSFYRSMVVNPFWGPSFGLCSPDPCANHILNVVALCGPQRGRERRMRALVDPGGPVSSLRRIHFPRSP